LGDRSRPLDARNQPAVSKHYIRRLRQRLAAPGHPRWQRNPVNALFANRILKTHPEARLLGASRNGGSGADEQCQRIGGGYKAVTFRFLLFL